MNWRECIFGDEALEEKYGREVGYRYGTKFVSPVENGIVADWFNMEKMWQHVFYAKLAAEPENHPVLVTEAVMNPKAGREMLLQVMFETFNVPAVCVCSTPLLCLQASRRSTGVVVMCDSSESSIYPIVAGHVVPHAASRACFHSGNDMTNHMITLLQRRGVAFPS